jgi:hypothetical protein
MFESLVISGINKSYEINCYQYREGEVHIDIACNFFAISVNKKGMKVRNTFVNSDTFLQRIKKWSDITHVHVFFEDGTDEYITVPWEGKHETNKLQRVYLDKDEVGIFITEEEPDAQNDHK